MPFKLFSSTRGLYHHQPPALTAGHDHQSVSRHCQVSPGAKLLQLRSVDLGHGFFLLKVFHVLLTGVP